MGTNLTGQDLSDYASGHSRSQNLVEAIVTSDFNLAPLHDEAVKPTNFQTNPVALSRSGTPVITSNASPSAAMEVTAAITGTNNG